VLAPTPQVKKPLRIALWVAGSLVLVFAILVGIAMRQSTREYVFVNGRSLQSNLEGRWDWSTRGKPCTDSAHTIAFSPDGKLMTITQQVTSIDTATGKDWTATTYDILSSKPTRIRGAIRGETRRTGSGVPVVWDLVVIGPNRYAWHRTDWPAFAQTAGVIRCDDAATMQASTGSMPPHPKDAPARASSSARSNRPVDLSDHYRGTLTNHQLPDQRVTLEFSIFHRSDSATAGWLQSGAPLNTKGITWVVDAATDEDSLYLVTQSPVGDTIVWASATRRGSIGGEYWFTDGRKVGRGGTWQLAPAPRLSAQTLTLVAAIVAGVLLLALFAGAAYGAERWWRWRARRPLVVTDLQRTQWGGVGGWLIFVVLGQSLVAIKQLVGFHEVIETYGDGWMLGAAIGTWRPLLVMEGAFQVFQIIGIVGGIVLIFRKSWMAPAYWMLFLASLVMYGLTDIIGTASMQRRMAMVFDAEAMTDFNAKAAAAASLNVRLMIGALLWSLYWARARRVALTFAPPRAMEPPPPTADPAVVDSSPVSPSDSPVGPPVAAPADFSLDVSDPREREESR
ncbi:MAG TPA: hypothetical protein VFT29_04850, partial [Gemmatimonadaceae bacterium]|nr:hypothetical protein [Gemmatimonadaceae bacterium]